MSLLIDRATLAVVGVHQEQPPGMALPIAAPDETTYIILQIPEGIPPAFANARRNADDTWEVYLDEEKKRDLCSLTYKSLRERRNRLLTESDWRVVTDSPLSSEELQAWRDYRTALRQFPSMCDPLNIVWPVAPDGSY